MSTEELQRRIAALPPHKRELFERMLTERASPRVRELSVTQHGLWFLDKLTPRSPLYTIAWRCELDGPLAAAQLTAAVNDVVARHEVLRTRFDVVDGRPAQVVLPTLEVPVPVVDLRAVPAADREAALEQRIRQELGTGLDLATGPLLRVRLYRRAPHSHVLLLLAHHIVFDYVSTDLFLAEMMERYGDRMAGRTDPPAPLPLQYGDFADWQREYLSGARWDRLVGYWRDQLAGSADVLPLPADRPRPPVQTFQGGSHRFRVPASVMDPLRQLAGRERVTLFMVYLSAFAVLMHRFSGEPAVNVGLAVDNRRHAQFRSLIGYFINAVVVRNDLTGDPSFEELLDRVRRACVDAYEHQDLPFDQVVEAVAPARGLSHNPLFQVTCALDEQPSRNLAAAGLTVSAIDGLHTGFAKFDLSFGGVVGPDGALVTVDYNQDLFDEATIAGLGRCFVALLRAIGTQPRRRISQLPLLEPDEQRQLAGAGSGAGPRVAGPDPAPFIDAVVDWADKAPEALAVVTATATVTYGEVLDRAAGLAYRLRAAGVGPQAVVGVRLPRGADAVTAILGVHLTGAACLPLDPALPVPPVAGMVAVVTADRSGPTGSAVSLHIDDAVPARADGPVRGPALPSLDSPAYLPATAGASGPPKRVALSYRGLTTAVAAEVAHLGVGQPDRVAHASELWTVEAVREVYLALTAGAALCVLPPLRSPDAEPVAALRSYGVSVARLAPVLARQVPAGALAGLRVVTTGGEAFAGAPAARWHGTQCRALTGYGTAETAGTVSWSGEPTGAEGQAPAGEPATGVRWHVLDPWLRPQPPGVPGELYLGGPQLALGYPGQPGLTAESFVPDPFGGPPGARLFRTGDRARRHRDGRVSLLGRVADRPPPGQPDAAALRVEAALSEHPDVADAVVVVHRPRCDQAVLTGYLVPAAAGTGPPDQRDLQAYLTDRLPGYLIPQAFVTLPRLPADRTGRVDRSALLPPASLGAVATARIAPRSATERVLAGLWSDLLGVGEVGSEDSFFDLGGHSLLAVQLLARVGELFGVDLQMRHLFHATTPAALAAEIADQLGGPQRAEDLAESVELVMNLSEEEVMRRLAAFQQAAEGSEDAESGHE